MTFIEIRDFTQQLVQLLDDSAYAEFQRELLENPHLGKVIPGCGGLRKIRVADRYRRQGKRGGFRVIYLVVPEADCVLLIDIYSKSEKADLAAGEKKMLRQLAQQLKQQVTKHLRSKEGDAE